MSNPTFIGVLVAAFLAIRFWRAMVALAAAFVIAALVVGLNQMADLVEERGASAPQQQLEQLK